MPVFLVSFSLQQHRGPNVARTSLPSQPPSVVPTPTTGSGRGLSTAPPLAQRAARGGARRPSCRWDRLLRGRALFLLCPWVPAGPLQR